MLTRRRSVLENERNVPISLIVGVETEEARWRPVMVQSIVRLEVGEGDLEAWAAFRRTIEILGRPTADRVISGGILLVALIVKIVSLVGDVTLAGVVYAVDFPRAHG